MSVTPVVFNGCFGWLHSGSKARGVVLCNMHGGEELVAHRALRRLAEQISAQGMPALRFDYRGTGNSCEDDLTPARLTAWCDSVVDAIAFLRSHSGVSEIALVGLGLGALIATLAAERVPALYGIVFLAPVVSGASYFPELHVLSKLHEAYESRYRREGDDQSRLVSRFLPGSDVELLGLTYLAETSREIGQVDLLDRAVAPAPKLLVFKHPRRDRRILDNKLVSHLRTLHAEVDEEDFVEYPQLMRGPAAGQYPSVAFDRATSWLAADLPADMDHADVAACSYQLRLPGLSETYAMFGDHAQLFGVTCQPDRVRPELPVLIILNTWWHHHVGIGRLSVTLSRHVAATGYTAFRFDATGIGDSAPPPEGENIPRPAQVVRDIHAAIEHLERMGYHQFVLFGVSWGANVAVQAAMHDHRIVGQILVNMRPRREGYATFDPRDTKVNTLLVLSSCDPGIPDALELRLEEEADPYSKVMVEFIEGADHSFRYAVDRAELIKHVTEHLPRLHRSEEPARLLATERCSTFGSHGSPTKPEKERTII